jgi:predicted site-specific integrase-resolvase
MKTKVYGTPKAAKLVGVHYLTLHRWISEGKIKPNGIPLADGRVLYQWTDQDIQNAKKVKEETRLGRPPKTKTP